MDDSSLNRAIDDVAREMTAAHLPADFRATVMARVPSAPRSGFPFPRFAVTAVTAASLVTAIFLWQSWTHREPSPTSQSPVEVAAAHPASNRVPPPPPTVEPAVTRRDINPVGAVQPRRFPTNVGHTGLAWEAGPEPLPGLDPIMIAAAGPATLAVPALEISPIQELDPIIIPAAGSGPPDPERRDR